MHVSARRGDIPSQSHGLVSADAPTERKFLNKRELMAQTGLSGPTIERYKKSGKIPFVQPGGKGARVLYPRNAVAAAATVFNPTEPTPSTVIAAPSPKGQGRRPQWQCFNH